MNTCKINLTSGIKRAFLGAALSISVLNPIAVLAQSNHNLNQLEQQKEDYVLKRDNLSTEMIAYMLFHPKASAALISSGGGIAAIADNSLNGAQKTFLGGMALLGVNHCSQSDNFQHCAEVATEIASYVNQINNYDEQINLLSAKIDSIPIVGVGVLFEIDDRYDIPYIVKAYPGSPANLNGLQKGMYIIGIDNISTEGKSLSQIANLLRGEKNSSVVIDYYDPDSDRSYQATIYRDEFGGN